MAPKLNRVFALFYYMFLREKNDTHYQKYTFNKPLLLVLGVKMSLFKLTCHHDTAKKEAESTG